MKPIKQIFRILYINYIFAKNGLDEVITSIRIFSPLRFIVYCNPWNWFRREKLTRGEAVRKSLEELGPVFVKFGQALSTRPDILPADVAVELRKLQDKVPPFSSEEAIAILEKAYGEPVYHTFAHFNPHVLASASMAQVHAATLNTGEDVVIKILRPNMLKIIQRDLGILHTIASTADRYWPQSKRFKPKEIVNEFERTILDELNLQREAANASQLRRNFEQSPLLYIPKIYWDYIKKNVLVMERIYGIPVTDIKSLEEHNVDIKKLAERGVEIFFTQVFRDRFFHADMHPGNIFVSLNTPREPQYICVDFGIIGILDEQDKRYLAENLLAFFNRDYHRVAELHIESGWVSRHTRVQEFESAIRTVCEPMFEKPLKDISFALIVMQLFQVARRFQMEVQPQLVLLQKTLFAIEGLGRQLYPDLNLWTTAKPFLEKWMRKQLGLGTLLANLRSNMPYVIEQLPHLPKLVHEVIELNKEHKQMMLAQARRNEDKAQDTQGYIELLASIVVAGVMLASIAYLDLSESVKTLTIAFGAAFTGGLASLGIRKNRR